MTKSKYTLSIELTKAQDDMLQEFLNLPRANYSIHFNRMVFNCYINSKAVYVNFFNDGKVQYSQESKTLINSLNVQNKLL